ncbi:YfcZ/YiiS family protein [Neiella marina]|uniref:YfcZ/YiiS family protein n=1 Tax=Neiella holothuriorum TaxID=2870530 RepID=A0ABS7EDN8_9GAMM|nr:YfcZ/YiiS family protein [Neiella holothuriorum]MBW8190437.1 YfcZ/YiiS family protein [Neiella holothuriorum]
MSKSVAEQIEDTPACCCVDVGSILDNSDTTETLSATCANAEAAEQLLAQWQATADGIASEPVVVKHEVQATEQGVELTASLTFSCQAELLIFQLGQR